MKQNNDAENKTRLRRWIWGSIGLVLLITANCFYFYRKVSSNHALASHYTIKGDPMEKYRNPAVAGLFYPAESKTLDSEVSRYLNTGYRRHEVCPQILIVPHAGYQYSASAAAQAYLPLKDYADKIKTVILLGPSHHVFLNGAALPAAEYFKTPLGRIPVNREISGELLRNKLFAVNAKAHRDEHSLEVQLPFLQKVLKRFSVVPIVYGNVTPERLAAALEKYLKRSDVLLVVSADLSHYQRYDEAVAMDGQTAAKIAEGRADVDDHHSCGAAGINAALILSRRLHLKPEMLALINSGDVSEDKTRVVGYGAWSFGREGNEVSVVEREYDGLKGFAGEYGSQIITAARRALQHAVKGKVYRPQRRDYDEHLFDRGAVFVTLHKDGELRGCVGSLYPRQAVVADIAANAAAAALEDGRFEPLAPEELDDVRISVSLLTGYERIDYRDEADLLKQMRSGTDGIVIRDGDRQGLFLPSVWEQLPDKKSFLNNLKLKAGMSPSFWSNDIKVYRFRTVEVKENGY